MPIRVNKHSRKQNPVKIPAPVKDKASVFPLIEAERNFSLIELRAAYGSIPSLAQDRPLLDSAEKLLCRIRESMA